MTHLDPPLVEAAVVERRARGSGRRLELASLCRCEPGLRNRLGVLPPLPKKRRSSKASVEGPTPQKPNKKKRGEYCGNDLVFDEKEKNFHD